MKKIRIVSVILLVVLVAFAIKWKIEKPNNDVENNLSQSETLNNQTETDDTEQVTAELNNYDIENLEPVEIVLDEVTYFENKEQADCHYSHTGYLMMLDELFADDPDRDSYRLCMYSSSDLNQNSVYVLFSIYGTNRVLYEGKGFLVSEDGNVFRVVGSFVDKELQFPYVGLDYHDNIEEPDLKFFCAEHYVCSILKGSNKWFYLDFANGNCMYPELDYIK